MCSPAACCCRTVKTELFSLLCAPSSPSAASRLESSHSQPGRADSTSSGYSISSYPQIIMMAEAAAQRRAHEMRRKSIDERAARVLASRLLLQNG